MIEVPLKTLDEVEDLYQLVELLCTFAEMVSSRPLDPIETSTVELYLQRAGNLARTLKTEAHEDDAILEDLRSEEEHGQATKAKAREESVLQDLVKYHLRKIEKATLWTVGKSHRQIKEELERRGLRR